MTDINDTANTAMEELEDPTNPGGQPPAETLLADLLDQEEAQETEEQESPAGMEEPDALDVEGVEEEEVDPLLSMADQVGRLSDSVDSIIETLKASPQLDVSISAVAIKAAVAAGIQQGISELLKAMTITVPDDNGGNGTQANTDGGALERNRRKILQYIARRKA